jgi:hypothetical protein
MFQTSQDFLGALRPFEGGKIYVGIVQLSIHCHVGDGDTPEAWIGSLGE